MNICFYPLHTFLPLCQANILFLTLQFSEHIRHFSKYLSSLLVEELTKWRRNCTFIMLVKFRFILFKYTAHFSKLFISCIRLKMYV